MPLALANIAFNLREGGDNEVPVHTHKNPSVEAGCSSTDQGGGKRRATKEKRTLSQMAAIILQEGVDK
jgi:hypothetical protein